MGERDMADIVDEAWGRDDGRRELDGQTETASMASRPSVRRRQAERCGSPSLIEGSAKRLEVNGLGEWWWSGSRVGRGVSCGG